MDVMKSFILFLGVFLFSCGHDENVQLVRMGNFNDHPEKEIGIAFDEFFSNPQWSSLVADDGITYVNVTGGMSFMEKEVEALIQFKVDLSNSTFEVNAFEMNGIAQNQFMINALIEKIYEDSE